MRRAAKMIGWLAFSILSPTWRLADLLKTRLHRKRRTALIVKLNRLYLAISSLAVIVTIAVTGNVLAAGSDRLLHPLCLLWGWFLWSRAFEVFYAFYRDAFNKLARTNPSSDLTWSRRVQLALNSYAELILNFALAYWMVSPSAWNSHAAPSSFTDQLFYSASTITTSGGGGFVPRHWTLQLMTAFEIACGLMLLVVCFAVYAGRALSDRPEGNGRISDDAGPAISPPDVDSAPEGPVRK